MNWFNKSKDGGLYLAGEYDNDLRNNTIRIYAHGNVDGIRGPDGRMIYNAKNFDDVLTNRSISWKNFRNNGNIGKMILDLRACNTGSIENYFAQKISKDPRFRGVVIIAPADYFIAKSDGRTTYVGGPGNYNMFLNGKLILGKFNPPQK
jgi:hypothetical protein